MYERYWINIFESHVGYVASVIILITGLLVLRYAPSDSKGMALYMVIPLTLYGFVIAATWLDWIADKIVDLLDLFGVLLNIPSTVLGLTILAFGSSIQDLVSNATLSKRGLSTMATTACFAGPIFNLCVGLGLSFWMLLRRTGKDEIHVELPRNIATGFWFTIVNCFVLMFAGVVVGKGRIGKGYSYVACGMYLLYVVISVCI